MYIGYAQYHRGVERKIDRRSIIWLLAGFVAVGLLCSILHKAVRSEWRNIFDVGGAAIEEVTEPALFMEVQEVTRIVNSMKPEAALIPGRDASNPLIVIDAGHGGEDTGCSRNGVDEKDINLDIAVHIKEQLCALGYEVLMTRESDETVSLEERVGLANDNGASLYISIHQNACEEETSDVRGIETYYNAGKEDDSKRLAQLIQQQLTDNTDALDREILANESLYVIRQTNMPACLVETGFLSNNEERELLVEEGYQEQLAASIVSGVELYFHPKTMYLTFDDGPSVENTSAVLDALKEHNIKATFFLVGENVEKHPEIARRIAQEGHTIGIHCYSHEYETLYESVDAYVADFERAWQVVFETTGVEAKLFRFPGGSINSYNKDTYKDIIEVMTEKGYTYFDWNASLEDAVSKSTPELLLANAKESTLGRKKVVMLAHDIVYNTTLCIDDLIEQFPEYQMLPLTEDVNPIQF